MIYRLMNWFLLFYLAYMWKIRASTTIDSVKSCVNCKFFLPPTDDLHNMANVRMGKCLMYPYGDSTVSKLVIGMNEPDISGLFRYAITARSAETMCGVNGIHFIKKPTFSHRKPSRL